jgi:multiple antibiotic resistance protein
MASPFYPLHRNTLALLRRESTKYMVELLTPVGKSALLVFLALLPIMNPFGNAAIFLMMTRRVSHDTRAYMAMRVGWNVAAILVVSMFVGSYVLDFFGISLPIVRVGGGLLVAANGWQLLNAEDSQGPDDAMTAAKNLWTPEEASKRAFFPLTFPITVGPGSVSVAITLGASLWGSGRAVAPSIAGALLGVALLALTTLLCYRYADRLLERLGSTGTTVLLRFSAFILLCIGVQIFWDGASELLEPWKA